jgi:hypothetical protein
MKTKNICPLMGDECLYEDCMWYDDDRPRCSVYIIADSLRFLEISAGKNKEPGKEGMKNGKQRVRRRVDAEDGAV